MSQQEESNELKVCDRCNKRILEASVSQTTVEDTTEILELNQRVTAATNSNKRKSTKDKDSAKKRKTSEPQAKANKRTPKKAKVLSRRPNRNGYTEFAAAYYSGKMACQVVGTNLRERAQFIAAEWKKLTNEEKEVYKLRAKLISEQTAADSPPNP